jgi:hypothetical protein
MGRRGSRRENSTRQSGSNFQTLQFTTQQFLSSLKKHNNFFNNKPHHKKGNNVTMAKNCFDLKTMTYSSPRPPIHLPTDPNLSLTSFLFQSTSSVADTTALTDAQTGESLTFRQLKTQVYDLSRSLLRLGIEQGDVVFAICT